MKKGLSYIGIVLLAVVLSACSSNDGGNAGGDTTMLYLYVYSPGKAVATRANVGYVTAANDERRINTLQIWVFKTGTNNLAGYMQASTEEIATLNSEGGMALQMVVDKAFGQTPTNVDVYVLANVTPDNSGLTFNATTTRDQLEAAMMGITGTTGGNEDAFGLTALTTSVPTDGLPMSGVLRDQPVVGESPVLRVGTYEELATVQLVRMVSKVRFVFSRAQDSEETIEIQGITLNGNMIPQDEYVFLDTEYDERTANVSGVYVSTTKELLASPITDAEIGKPEDTGKYVYVAQESQDYENLILDGIEENELTPVGPFYFRETDKILSGKISYAIGGGETKEATFSVAAAGDFSRNHTWIVYAHYGTSILDVITVEVLDWRTKGSDPRNLYNW